jgi:hypothetical protein
MAFEEVKTRANKKPGSIHAFTPSKRVKFEGHADEEIHKSFGPMEIPTAIKLFLNPAATRSEGVSFALSETAWDAVNVYLAMLDQKLPALQDVIAKAKLAMMEMVM